MNPPTIDDLAETIGFSATLRIAAWFAMEGCIDTASDGRALARLLGVSLARRLCDRWPATRLPIPRTLAVYDDTLHLRRVVVLVDAGVGMVEAAHLCHCTEPDAARAYREAQRAGLTGRGRTGVARVRDTAPTDPVSAESGAVLAAAWSR